MVAVACSTHVVYNPMTMSFPYQQFVDYSNPNTPRVYSTSWELPAEQDAMQMPQQQEQQTMQQHQQQHQHQQHQERVSPSQLHLQQLPPPPPLPVTAQDTQQPQVPPQPQQRQQQRQQQGQYTPHQPTIALQATSAQPQYRFDITTEEHFIQQAQGDARPGSSSSRRGGASKPPLHVDTSRASSAASPGALSSAGAGAGPLRAPRGTHAQSAHPYRRPQSRAASGSSTAGGAAPAPAPVRSRRVSELQTAETSAGGAPRGVVPAVGTAMAVGCPAGDTWRQDLLGLQDIVGASHDPEATPTATPRPQQHLLPAEPVRRYSIRADIHYNADENLIIAMFELPGVKRSDLRITMGVCPFSRVRQINIVGISRPQLPSQGHGVRERKFGQFMRTLPVPPETKPEDVTITLEDGILTLKIPGGAPAQVEEPQEIPIS